MSIFTVAEAVFLEAAYQSYSESPLYQISRNVGICSLHNSLGRALFYAGWELERSGAHWGQEELFSYALSAAVEYGGLAPENAFSLAVPWTTERNSTHQDGMQWRRADA